MTNKKVVLITGANSGVGYATAKIIAQSSPNYHVLVAARTPSKGETAVSSLRSQPKIQSALSYLQLDITDPASIDAAFNTVKSQYGRLDVLVNNAGIASTNPSFREQLIESYITNTVGSALVYEAFKPLLIKAPKAYLIHVSSGLGSFELTSDPKAMVYNMPLKAYRMSKAALDMNALEDYKEKEREGWNMKVFALCPGLVESNLRGTAPEQVSAGGLAISADTSGETILSVIEGKRDADDGKFIHKDGVYGW